MCTAILFKTKDSYFGRNLDYEHSFGEKIIITPENYAFNFKYAGEVKHHYAIIGMGVEADNYPLYFDAINEKGLGIVALNFASNALYFDKKEGKENIASYEFILWVLSECESTEQARSLIEKTNITNDFFSKDLKPTPLHWLIADKNTAVTVEQTKDGMKIYDNPVGVLTNNPTFDFHMMNLNNFLNLTSEEPKNRFSTNLDLSAYSRGMGAIGLPGDNSSASRFVRACFVKMNSVCEDDSEILSVNQFFHILYSVYQQNGCAKVGDKYEITNYTSCCNLDKGIYYYTTYNNSEITAVDMHRENLSGSKLITFELKKLKQFNFQN